MRHPVRGLAVALLTIGLLVTPRGLLASPDDYWDTRFYANGTNVGGIVYAIAVSGSDVYVGGNFTSMFGVRVNNIAHWDGATWSALGNGVMGFNNTVHALAVSGTDLYVGGSFSTAGGGAAQNVARWNGATWSALGSGMNGRVFALRVSGSTVYAGGEFTNAGGSGANRIAQWNGSSWSALGTGMNDNVLALATAGSTLYAGGDFTTAGGGAASHIAQWDGTSWSGLGTGISGGVRTLAINGTDVYAGGGFGSAGGGGANNVARWDGSSWSSLGSGTNNPVSALAVVGSDLYAMGRLISTAGGTPVKSIARWNGTSWSSLAGSGVNIGDSGVAALTSSGTDLYVGSEFAGVVGTGIPAISIARWDGSAWSLATTTPGLGIAHGGDIYPGIHVLARSPSGDLYAGGVFEFAGTNASAISIAKFDGTGWSALGSGLEGPNLANFFHGFANAIAFYGGDVIVGGNFSSAGGVSANHIARWDGSTFAAMGSGAGGGQVTVNALAVYNGELYAGGSFSGMDGVPGTSFIARWNGTSWSAVGSGVDGTVNAFAIIGSDLYVGGSFSNAGGGSAPRVARWNGTSWSAVGSGPGGTPAALAAVGTNLYAGGSFGNGSAIMKWDGTNWTVPGGGICTFCGNGGHNVGALAAIGTDLYVGGNFDSVGSPSIPASGIAKWDGANWSSLGSGVNSGVGGLAVAGSDLYVGAVFSLAGGKPESFISLWHNCGNGVVDQAEQCDDLNTVSGDCCSSTCQSETAGNTCPDDGNPCTNDQCDGAGGCTHPNNTAPCDDNVFCNGFDVCSGGVCTHAGDPCPGPDGDIDCSESCDEATDSCTAPDPNGSVCDDGDGCTIGDTCNGGVCQPGGPKNCADPNPCTDDSCSSPSGTCVHTNNTASCDDGLFCNGTDTCAGGVCNHSGDPCTSGAECANACNEAADNCFDLPGTPCMADTNLCTTDICDGAGACTHPNVTDGTGCSDGNPCTSGEVCTAGVCGGGTPLPQGCIDHYLCYKVKSTVPFTQPTVTLDDQFGMTSALLKGPKNLCPPADKDSEGIHDDVTHEEAYRLKPAAPEPRHTNLTVTDQFGTLQIDTSKPDRLLVPTNKGLGSDPPAPAPGVADHYKCYKAKITRGTTGFPKGTQATVADQFQTRLYDVKKPKLLCNPVSKNGEPIEHPLAHLLCYTVKHARGQLKHTPIVGQIFTENQFGSGRLDTVKEDVLCVPATKTP